MSTPNGLSAGQVAASDFIVSKPPTSPVQHHRPEAVGSDHCADPQSEPNFVDRRRHRITTPTRTERRQFGNSHQGLSDAGKELAVAIDRYKVENHRRYLTCDEMISVLSQLGYARTPA